MKYDKDPRHHCTIPTLFHAREWFENKFGDLCKAHDEAYENRTGKLKADYALLRGMNDRGYPSLAILTGIFLVTFGNFYYYTR